MRLSEVERLTAHIESGSDEVLNSIVALVSAHFGVPIAMVSIVDHEFQTYKAKLGIEADGAPLADSFCVHCMHGEGILEILWTMLDSPTTRWSPAHRSFATTPAPHWSPKDTRHWVRCASLIKRSGRR